MILKPLLAHLNRNKGLQEIVWRPNKILKKLTNSEIHLLFYKSTDLFLCSNLILRKLKVVDKRVLKIFLCLILPPWLRI